jgi:hypothetical protein
VTDIKQSRRIPHSLVLGAQSRVLNGHFESSKRNHPRASGYMHIIKWGLGQGLNDILHAPKVGAGKAGLFQSNADL